MTTAIKQEVLTRDDVLEAVEQLEAAVSAWEQAEEPTAEYQGRTVKAISDALVDGATELFNTLATADIEPEAWPLVLAADRFEAALINWAKRTESQPHRTDPEGGTEVWGPYQELLRAKTPRRWRQPTPIKALIAQNVTYRQIAKEYGWYLSDGRTPDETRVLEEISNPGMHYKPDSYVHPHDARYLRELEAQWNERCEGLEEGTSEFGELAAASRREDAPKRKKEWKPPPESIEELLRQNVNIAQIAKMHRVELDDVRRLAAEIGVFNDPSVWAFVKGQDTPDLAQQRHKAEILRTNSHPECLDIEERIVAISEDGHPPGRVAEILRENGHPEITHQRVTRVLKAWAESGAEQTEDSDA